MPYLLLALGLLLGLYGLYKFFLYANLKQITALLMTAAFVVACAALFFLAMTGRLPAALGLLLALWPIGVALWSKKSKKTEPPNMPDNGGPMTRREALDILGLEDGATAEEIKAAHKKLIKKAHPDQEGSSWMAAKINQARDTLLG